MGLTREFAEVFRKNFSYFSFQLSVSAVRVREMPGASLLWSDEDKC